MSRPRAEHLDVRLRGLSHRVQVNPPVVLRLALGDRVRRQPPHVVERLAPGQPGDAGVPAPVDRPVHQLAGRDVKHPQQRLLVPAMRELIGEQPALLVRLPGVQRRPPGGIDRNRIDQHALAGAASASPVPASSPRGPSSASRPECRAPGRPTFRKFHDLRRRERRAPGPDRAGCRTASSRARRAAPRTRPGAAPAPGRRTSPGRAGPPGSPPRAIPRPRATPGSAGSRHPQASGRGPPRGVRRDPRRDRAAALPGTRREKMP